MAGKGRRTTGVWVFGGEVDGGVEVGYLVCEGGLAEHLGFYCVDKGADLCCACTGGMKRMLGGKGCSGRVASGHSIQSIHNSEIMSEIIQTDTMCNIPRTCSGGPSSRL